MSGSVAAMEPRMSSAIVALLLVMVLVGSAAAGSLRYDQTQTGDTNIHLEVKNVEVLALLDDSSFEYEYDYNELTEKPPKPGANSTWATYDPVVEAAAANATGGGAPAPEQPVLSSTAPPAPAPIKEVESTPTPAPAGDATSPAPASSTTPGKRTRRCGAGFHRDAHGHCRRNRRPNLQMLMNLGRKPPQSAAQQAPATVS